jgi:SAM-dependent methyltransferase
MKQAAAGSTPEYAEVRGYFDRFAAEEDKWLRRTGGYHAIARGIFSSLVPPGRRILEIGCGRGDLLAHLDPSRGVGVDVSPGMVEAARERHPSLEFACAAGEELELGETFDYIVLSDVVHYAHDLQRLFEKVAAHSHPQTRVVVSTYSNLWRPLLSVLAALRIRPRRPASNWVAPKDLVNLLELSGMQAVVEREEILAPVRVPLLSRFLNGYVARLPILRALTLTHWIVARPVPAEEEQYGVSVIVPARNEAGSIRELVERIPEMGRETELIFVEGHSEDDTRARIEDEIERRPDRKMRLLAQTGKGKWNAVQEGFAAASNEVLMIVDGDMTVGPEDLTKFYAAIVRGHGDLINGSRLVYGMEPGAMRFLNMLGNKFFAWLLSFVLGQYVKDTLCGTKALHRDQYRRIADRRQEFAVPDPFGDFDLLLGAALLGLKISNVPVRYRARIYGETNIRRFANGRMLLRLTIAGYRRIWVAPIAR